MRKGTPFIHDVTGRRDTTRNVTTQRDVTIMSNSSSITTDYTTMASGIYKYDDKHNGR